jgi:hypothetical protein
VKANPRAIRALATKNESGMPLVPRLRACADAEENLTLSIRDGTLADDRIEDEVERLAAVAQQLAMELVPLAVRHRQHRVIQAAVDALTQRYANPSDFENNITGLKLRVALDAAATALEETRDKFGWTFPPVPTKPDKFSDSTNRECWEEACVLSYERWFSNSDLREGVRTVTRGQVYRWIADMRKKGVIRAQGKNTRLEYRVIHDIDK